MQRRTALFVTAGAAIASMLGGSRDVVASTAPDLSIGARFHFDVEHQTTAPSGRVVEWRGAQRLDVVAPHDGGLLSRFALTDGDRAPLNDPMAPLVARLRSGFSDQPSVVHLDPLGRPLNMFGWRELVSKAFADAKIHQRDDRTDPVTYDLDFAKRVITTIPSRTSGAAIAEHVTLWSLGNRETIEDEAILPAPWGDPLAMSVVEQTQSEADGAAIVSTTLLADANAMRAAHDALYHRTYLAMAYRLGLNKSLPADPSIRCEIDAKIDLETGFATEVAVRRTIDMGPAWPAEEIIKIDVAKS